MGGAAAATVSAGPDGFEQPPSIIINPSTSVPAVMAFCLNITFMKSVRAIGGSGIS